MSGIHNLVLDNIFEQVTSGQTKAAQSMRERIANWRMRRLAQAQRTRLLFHELAPTFHGVTPEIVTAYSDDFGQPLLAVAGVTDMVGQTVRLSDTVNNRNWSQDPVPVHLYAGRPLSANIFQPFSPQAIPAGAKISGDFTNKAVGLYLPAAGIGRLILTCYYIAQQVPPATQQELDALKAAEKAIKEGTPPQQTTIPAILKVTGAAGETISGTTKPTDRVVLITGLTFNVGSAYNAKIAISDSTSNAAWMKKKITWWGVAADTFADAPVYELPKPYYLPAGAEMTVELQNTLAADGVPIPASDYTFGFVAETP